MNLLNLFRKKSVVVKDLGSVVKLNRERKLTREYEKHSQMFNEMLNDIHNGIYQGLERLVYPYDENRLRCVNSTRNSFNAWGRRHNLSINIIVQANEKPPTITIYWIEIE